MDDLSVCRASVRSCGKAARRRQDGRVVCALVDEERSARQRRLIGDVVGIADGVGVEVWLRGGWATDFFLGRVTRDHEDVDWFAWAVDAPALTAALTAAGHEPLPGRPPTSNSTSAGTARTTASPSSTATPPDASSSPALTRQRAEPNPSGRSASIQDVKSRDSISKPSGPRSPRSDENTAEPGSPARTRKPRPPLSSPIRTNPDAYRATSYVALRSPMQSAEYTVTPASVIRSADCRHSAGSAAGPLRLLDGDFPAREAMAAIAEHNLVLTLGDW
ncbi:hypothetical protein PUR71_08245 [Streptomyces sp. SP17BM10]|uniref:nucleotidyltransferase domain-containing protein n=1 Tax=Streptomyces sp. SP17BM10 TaxID=3002530 RepID=UPI002E7644E7|nr:hypothetical protein [Streptomyces sp. SP17BM10]MEE1782905.1 hypothetical protein [Streptomyces sp. SP17BM10]